MSVHRSLQVLAVSACILPLLASAANAAEPRHFEAPGQNPLISDGTLAENCQWPTTVLLLGDGICSGTLIHPQIVATAAHCPDVNQVHFGESDTSAARVVDVEYCLRNPDWGMDDNDSINVGDYAFCKLSQPINDIPIAPPMYGCELAMLSPGAPAVIVGFGMSDGGLEAEAGLKRWAQTIIQTPVNDASEIVVVGEVGHAACGGDSGGPAYYRFPDGSWHTFGIVSGGPECGEGANSYTLINRAVPFIEESSGVDVTPCHDVNGDWAPTAACGGFATDPTNTSATWTNGCSTRLSGLSATCGPAYGAPPDNNAPSVSIVDPQSGASLDVGESLDIMVEANDPEFGIVAVDLVIDGELVATDDHEPWIFGNASFGAGTFELVAIAEDYGGNVTQSATVVVNVVGGSGDGESGGPGVDTSLEDEPGCGCSSHLGRNGSGVLMLGLGVLLICPYRRGYKRQRHSAPSSAPGWRVQGG